MELLHVAARVTLIVVFSLSASSKARSRRGFGEFVASISAMTGLRSSSARRLAGCVLLMETLVIPALVLQNSAPAALAIAFVLLLAFTLVLLRAIDRGVTQSCNCFGAAGTRPGRLQVGRNIGLLIVAILGLVGIMSSPSAQMHPAPFFAASIIGLVIGLIAAMLDHVASLLGSETNTL